jgi:putative cell wall-binding protein
MPRRAIPLAALLAVLMLALAACGRDDDPGEIFSPDLGVEGTEENAALELGFPTFATKNTTRVGGADPIANAAAVARASFPGDQQRPAAVALVDVDDWRASIAASSLMGTDLRAPVLFTDGDDIPAATQRALEELEPSGAQEAGGAQVILVGDVPTPSGYETTEVRGDNYAALARAIDALGIAAAGSPSDNVIIATAEQAPFAMPAAGWAAKSGDPVLYVNDDGVPDATREALRSHQQPRIYVLGPSRLISPDVTKTLRELGTVTRVGGQDPISNAVEFARFNDGRFGWGIVDPGHGVVLLNGNNAADAAAAAPLSTSGKYGPLLLVDDAGELPAPVREFLLDIQPGFDEDPVRGVYNHAWIIGDEDALTPTIQAQVDALLEIVPVNATPPPAEEEEEPEPEPEPEEEEEPDDEDSDEDAPNPTDPAPEPLPIPTPTTPQ